MKIDQDRIRAIREAEHSFYGYQVIPIRRDRRWVPDWEHHIAPQLSPEMRVLDVGCGGGQFLLELSASFHTGLGIDNDPAHIQMAEEAKREQGVQNVEFRLLDYPGEVAQLRSESFDMVVSLRGPVPETAASVQAAHQLLRPDGLIFCEEIAELHHKEVVELFGAGSQSEMTSKVDEVRELLEQNGFEVRLAVDVFTKWFYPDVYAWFQFICGIWTWLGSPLPEPDDPRIGVFAERNTTASGEIETTHHVGWVAGVKL
jgi:2-polyprenyl-3-methyl-5-hydroxy-6-metoxy-1,4-benzoquinol methylase